SFTDACRRTGDDGSLARQLKHESSGAGLHPAGRFSIGLLRDLRRPSSGRLRIGRQDTILLHNFRVYASRTTFTVTSAVTSRCSLTASLCSPSFLIGSSSWIFRRSTVKCCFSSASATSFAVTEPKS